MPRHPSASPPLPTPSNVFLQPDDVAPSPITSSSVFHRLSSNSSCLHPQCSPLFALTSGQALQERLRMVAQSYERVRHVSFLTCDDLLIGIQVPGSEAEVPQTPHDGEPQTPDSPPPPFRSRASSIASRRHPSQYSSGPVDRTLEDTFDAGPNADVDNDAIDDDRQRLMRDAATRSSQDPGTRRSGFARAVTSLPSIFGSSRGRNTGPSATSNDGVFANINAKPESGEKMEEQPPVSRSHLVDIDVASNGYSPMNKQLPMPRRHTGKPP